MKKALPPPAIRNVIAVALCPRCAKAPIVHEPSRIFEMSRTGPGQYHVHDAEPENEGALIHVGDWPKCLGDRLILLFRDKTLRNRTFSIIAGSIHIFPKSSKHHA